MVQPHVIWLRVKSYSKPVIRHGLGFVSSVRVNWVRLEWRLSFIKLPSNLYFLVFVIPFSGIVYTCAPFPGALGELSSITK